MQTTFISKLIKYRLLLLMLLPSVLFFVVFSYLPMLGIVIAFKRYDYAGGIFGSPWAGFDNFKFLFLGGNLFNVLRNTVFFNLAFIIVNNLFQITAAIVLTEIGGKIFKKISQSMLFLPYFISWVVVGAFVFNIFNNEYGFFNTFLSNLGMETVNIYDKQWAWVLIIIVLCLWKNMGYGSVLYLAAISGIDQCMYEAADIDGANVFQRILHITLPSLTSTIIILVLLSIGNIFRGDFSMFYQIVGDNSLVFSTTDVIDTFVTRSLLQTREFGMSSAAGLIQSVLCFIIINIANFTVKKVDSGYALY